MKLITMLWLAMWLTPAAGQDSTTDRVTQIMTFSYPMDSSGVMYLAPTPLLPRTDGTVRLARGSVAIDIDVLVEHLPPPQNLGAYNSYVVWLISPDGDIRNIGELLLNGDSGILQTTTNWGAFGIFVTAELDNCGTCPSHSVVLANESCVGGLQPVRLLTIVCREPSVCGGKRTALLGGTR
jgi:hypothetical protein